jgi:hypothetical protein
MLSDLEIIQIRKQCRPTTFEPWSDSLEFAKALQRAWAAKLSSNLSNLHLRTSWTQPLSQSPWCQQWPALRSTLPPLQPSSSPEPCVSTAKTALRTPIAYGGHLEMTSGAVLPFLHSARVSKQTSATITSLRSPATWVEWARVALLESNEIEAFPSNRLAESRRYLSASSLIQDLLSLNKRLASALEQRQFPLTPPTKTKQEPPRVISTTHPVPLDSSPMAISIGRAPPTPRPFHPAKTHSEEGSSRLEVVRSFGRRKSDEAYLEAEVRLSGDNLGVPGEVAHSTTPYKAPDPAQKGLPDVQVDIILP